MSDLHHDAACLTSFIRQHRKLVVLTGAGISVDSGIPSYRDHDGNWLPAPPIQERAFVQCEQTRKRYWARSWYGWPRIRDAQPNAAHLGLAALERHDRIELIITQNVDGLHQKAGSRKVVDLHGRVDRTRCLDCAAEQQRENVQQQLAQSTVWPDQPLASARPDGDSDVDAGLVGKVTLPHCPNCGGDLRPDVVFFGGSVPAARLQQCLDALQHADALLVLGTSLTVYSGYRFCRRASELGKAIAIVNPGSTRADDLAQLRLFTLAGALLTAAVADLQVSEVD